MFSDEAAMKIDFHLHHMVSDTQWIKTRLSLMDEAGVGLSVLHPLPHLSFMGETCGDNEDVLRVVRDGGGTFLG